MKLIVTMPVRSEGWIIGLTARAVLSWADHLVILDHCSTDDSREIEKAVADEFPGRVTILLDDDPVWYECAHRQRLLDTARELGATHVFLCDADEILTANLIPTIRGTIEQMPKNQILQLPWVCLARGLDRYYAAGVWFDNWVSCAFEDHPDAHWKSRGGEEYDFHHRHPMGRPVNLWRPITQSANPAEHQGGLFHLQFVSEQRLKAKQYLYQVTERLRWPERSTPEQLAAMYGRSVHESDPNTIATAEVPAAWWAGYEGLVKHLDIGVKPWQLEACGKIIRENPGIETGLDSFGLGL